MSNQLGFSINYKIRNHIHGRVITFKNQMGLISDVPYTEPHNRSDEGLAIIDVELNLFDMKSSRFNIDLVTNALDRAIVEKVLKQIGDLKKNNGLVDYFPNHVGEKIIIQMPLNEVACNYRTNGFQSDIFGCTIEFKEEAYPGFYKEEEYHDELVEIIDHYEVNNHESFVRDFIFRLYRVVDNGCRIGTLWVQIGGEPIRIDPIRDMTKQDGIYIYSGTGGKPLKVISPEDITKELLAAHGISKTKLDMEQAPHSKIYSELNKNLDGYKKKVKELEAELIAIATKHRESITKLSDALANLNFEMKEKDRIINRMKERAQDQKDKDTFEKTTTTATHKTEIERLKHNNTKDNIGNFIKILKDIIPMCTGMLKLFV